MTYLKILFFSLTVLFNLTIHATQAYEEEHLLESEPSIF
jgi:hypothetical protein